ncbi:MAG: aminotransferase class V-fold PLP-dependent enzyme [Planctomycetota bacterium]|nr:aminotransferase class V-fold PLP-dependent enzyme [Planctomycetota bacterium]
MVPRTSRSWQARGDAALRETYSMIYFDNAATSYPKPPEVFDFMLKFMREAGGNPGRAGHRMATGAEAMIGECRNALSKFFGVKDPARCIFTLNCSDALNMAIKGVLRAGDHVVTTALEHNSINRPLQRMADEGFITLTRVAPSEQGAWHTEEIVRAVTPKTRLVALTHCANVTGVVNPVVELGRTLRAATGGDARGTTNVPFVAGGGPLLLVDAAQTGGVVPLDMEAACIDLLALAGHKGLYGPTGTGALLLGARLPEDALGFWREGGTGGDSTKPHQPSELPHRLEGGTPNTMGIAGLLAGVRFLNRAGAGKPLEHEREIMKYLIGELEGDKRFTIYGTRNLSRKVGVLSLTIKDRDPVEVATILDQSFAIAVRPGLHCAPYTHKHLGTFPNGTVRLSPGFFNTLDEAAQVVKALREVAS